MLSTTKRAALKTSLQQNCRLSHETQIYKEPLDAPTACFVNCPSPVWREKLRTSSFGCADFLSADSGLYSLDQTKHFGPRSRGSNMNKRFGNFLPNNLKQMTKQSQAKPSGTARPLSGEFTAEQTQGHNVEVTDKSSEEFRQPDIEELATELASKVTPLCLPFPLKCDQEERIQEREFHAQNQLLHPLFNTSLIPLEQHFRPHSLLCKLSRSQGGCSPSHFDPSTPSWFRSPLFPSNITSSRCIGPEMAAAYSRWSVLMSSMMHGMRQFFPSPPLLTACLDTATA